MKVKPINATTALWVTQWKQTFWKFLKVKQYYMIQALLGQCTVVQKTTYAKEFISQENTEQD